CTELQRGPQTRPEIGHLGVAPRRHFLDVGATREGFPPAVEDHRTNIVPGARGASDLRKLGLHLVVECVHRRAIQPDRADTRLDLETHELCHVDPPLRRCACLPGRLPASNATHRRRAKYRSPYRCNTRSCPNVVDRFSLLSTSSSSPLATTFPSPSNSA